MRRRLLNGTALGIAFAMGLPMAQPANAACVFPAPTGGDDALSCSSTSLTPSNIDLLDGNDSVTLDNVFVGDLNEISTFYGNAGNDAFSILNGTVLSFLSGSETTLLGGDGLDSFTFDNVMISVGVNTNALFDGGADNDSFVVSNGTMLGSGGKVTAIGGLGDDSFAFNSLARIGGNDQVTIDGGDGLDSFSFDNVFIANGVGSTVTVQGGAGIDTFTFANTAIVGSVGQATIDGGEGNDIFNFNDEVRIGGLSGFGAGVILGGQGDDSFNISETDPFDVRFIAIGYAGEGTLDAGDGNDSFNMAGMASLYVGLFDDAHGVLIAGDGDDTLTGNLRIGFRGQGEVYGGSGAERFSGMELTMAASQSLGGTCSEALLDLGTGNDTIEYQEVFFRREWRCHGCDGRW